MLDQPTGIAYALADRHSTLRPKVAAMQRNLRERIAPAPHRMAGPVSRHIVMDLHRQALRVISREKSAHALRGLTVPPDATYRQLLDLTDEIAAALDAFHRAHSTRFGDGSFEWRIKRGT